MNDGRGPEMGADLAFDARMRKHQEDVAASNERLEAAARAVAEAGGLSPVAQKYVDASNEMATLKANGNWLLAAESTLTPPQREAIATVGEDIARNNVIKPK